MQQPFYTIYFVSTIFTANEDYFFLYTVSYKKFVMTILNLVLRGLETLQMDRRASIFFQSINLNEMVMCLEDLINYFAQPEDDMGKDALNKQDL